MFPFALIILTQTFCLRAPVLGVPTWVPLSSTCQLLSGVHAQLLQTVLGSTFSSFSFPYSSPGKIQLRVLKEET